MIKVCDYDFDYPEELVACEPSQPRDACRLLVLDRASSRRAHAVFRDLPRWLRAGDCLVLNRTKVLACRLRGRKSTGGKAELLLVRELGPGRWSALASGFKKGQRLEFDAGLSVEVEGLTEDGEYVLAFSQPDVAGYLDRHGLTPLPPYILKKKSAGPRDAALYQTVYARDRGSIAAPTAGLHFTPELLAALRAGGVRLAWLTLHVGRGTFKPIQGEDASAHTMLPERYELSAGDAAVICAAQAQGRRIVAVGTTATRALETLAGRPQGFGAGEGWSELYLYPGSRFALVGGLVTNFHLPRSTPLMLAAAFAGREPLLAAYREAVAMRYRLYSYGDAMLIL